MPINNGWMAGIIIVREISLALIPAILLIYYEWMDGWMDEWMDEWMDGWLAGIIISVREISSAKKALISALLLL